jgi:pimeloyl-ACP methyl ester carboxylesterase
MTLSNGGSLSFLTAGDPNKPTLLLIHGFPSSSRMFREVIPRLAEVAFIVAPDMPGFGHSDVLPKPSFDSSAAAIRELLIELAIGPRVIYLHDFGAPLGLQIAMTQPELVLGLIIQNANAHQSGFGPQWEATKSFWIRPTAENAERATAHLTFEGTRGQYVAQVPAEIAARIDPHCWEEDWRIMQLPGRLDTQKALIADYGNYVSNFDSISAYLKKHQPPGLMIWGRHDGFFELEETVSWMRDLPRMEAHILNAGHFLLETEGPKAAELMLDFMKSTILPRGK